MKTVSYDILLLEELQNDISALRDIIFAFADSAQHGSMISCVSLNYIAMCCDECGEKLSALFGESA